MIANILLLFFLGLMAYWWGFVQGLFSSFVHLVAVIVAGALAFSLWEPTAHYFLNSGTFATPGAWGLSLLSLFLIFLIVIRGTANKLVPKNMDFGSITNMVGGGCLGLLSGILTTGVTIIGLQLMPVSSVIGGYEPYVLDEEGKVTPNSGSILLLKVDHVAARFYSMLSGTVFYAGDPMAQYRPDMTTAAGTFRLGMDQDQNASLVAAPQSVEVTNLATHPTPVPELDPNLADAVGENAAEAGYQFVVVNVTATSEQGRGRGTYDGDSTLRLRPSQVQLISWNERAGRIDTQLHALRAFVRTSDVTGEKLFRPILNPATVVNSVVPTEEIGCVFVVPLEQSPKFLLVRHLRLAIPDVDPQRHTPEMVRYEAGAYVTAFAGRDPTDDSASVPKTLEVALTNNVPKSFSSNYAPALKFEKVHKRNQIVSGQERIAPHRISPFENKVLVSQIYTPTHLAAVRVIIQEPQRELVFGNLFTVTRAHLLQRVIVVDEHGGEWEPIGYILHHANGAQEISFDPLNRIRAAENLPIKEMKDRRDKLYLYYQVKRGTRLAEFRVGTTYQQTLADFTTPE